MSQINDNGVVENSESSDGSSIRSISVDENVYDFLWKLHRLRGKKVLVQFKCDYNEDSKFDGINVGKAIAKLNKM